MKHTTTDMFFIGFLTASVIIAIIFFIFTPLLIKEEHKFNQEFCKEIGGSYVYENNKYICR